MKPARFSISPDPRPPSDPKSPISAPLPALPDGVKGRPPAERGSGARCPSSSRTWRITDGQRGGAPWRPLTPDGDAGQDRWPGAAGRAGRGDRGGTQRRASSVAIRTTPVP